MNFECQLKMITNDYLDEIFDNELYLITKKELINDTIGCKILNNKNKNFVMLCLLKN